MRRTALAPALVAALLLTAGCGGGSDKADDAADAGSSATKPGATVDMNFTLFKQTEVAIKTGEALTFVNNNPIKHIIVQGPWKAGPDGLRTEEMDDGTYMLTVEKKGDKVEHVFDKAGTFQFFCTIHKGMSGTVTVS